MTDSSVEKDVSVDFFGKTEEPIRKFLIALRDNTDEWLSLGGSWAFKPLPSVTAIICRVSGFPPRAGAQGEEMNVVFKLSSSAQSSDGLKYFSSNGTGNYNIVGIEVCVEGERIDASLQVNLRVELIKKSYGSTPLQRKEMNLDVSNPRAIPEVSEIIPDFEADFLNVIGKFTDEISVRSQLKKQPDEGMLRRFRHACELWLKSRLPWYR